MKFRKNYLIMNEFDENEAGGGTEEVVEGKTEEASKGQTETEVDPVESLKAQYEAQIAAMNKKNAEILNELKGSKSKLKEIEEVSKKEQMEKLEKDGDLEKILEITKRELEEIKSQLLDKEERELEEKEQLLKEARVAEFKKRMGDVEFHDFEEAIKSVDLSKFIMTDNGWNEEGIKQAVSDFKQNKHYHFKSKKPDLPGDAAGGRKHQKASSYDEYLKSFFNEE